MKSLINPHTYNIGALDRWQTLKSEMEADKNSILNINFIGDSLTSGAYCGTYNITNYLNNCFVSRVKNHFNNKYQNAGNGMIAADWVNPSDCSYFTYTGTWHDNINYPYTTLGGIWRSATTYEANASISIPFTGEGIRIFYQQGDVAIVNNGTKAGGTFTTSLDEGEAVERTTVGTNDRYKYLDLDGLSNEAHTVVVTFTGTSDQCFNFFGAMELKDIEYGIRTSNMGRNGAAVGWYFGSQTIREDLANIHPADLAVLAIGVNDYTSSDYTSNNYPARLELFVQDLLNAGSDVLFVVEPEPTNAVHDPPYSDYVDVKYDLCDKYDLALIDIDKRFGTRGGLKSGDKIHLSPKGSRDVARGLLNILD